MKKSKVVIPIMVVVAVLATWILQKDFSEVPFLHKLLITVGACIVSGGLGYVLLGSDVQKVDPKPNQQAVNKKGSRK